MAGNKKGLKGSNLPGVRLALAVLAAKESRLQDPPVGTSLIPLVADPDDVLGEVVE